MRTFKPDPRVAQELMARGHAHLDLHSELNGELRKVHLIEAECAFRMALIHDPCNVEALVALSYIKFLQSDFAEALTYTSRAEQISPTDLDVRIRKGLALLGIWTQTRAPKTRAQAISYLRGVMQDPDCDKNTLTWVRTYFQDLWEGRYIRGV